MADHPATNAASLFFGASAGRSGTMTLANLLNAEDRVVCLHEGKIRRLEESGEQWLPFLTLQNLEAYRHPDRAVEIFRRMRSKIVALAEEHDLVALGDIAYNNSPFVGAIPEVFPQARLMVLIRDGRDFVRSAYTGDQEDPTPVGWPKDRPLSKLEQYIALGRLRPAGSSAEDSPWHRLTPLEKNAWLWAETNRIIFDNLSRWPEDRVLVLRLEDFVADPLATYAQVRRFLRLPGPMPEAAPRLIEKKINHRSHYVLPPWKEWSPEMTSAFWDQAGEMMQRLGYA